MLKKYFFAIAVAALSISCVPQPAPEPKKPLLDAADARVKVAHDEVDKAANDLSHAEAVLKCLDDSSGIVSGRSVAEAKHAVEKAKIDLKLTKHRLDELEALREHCRATGELKDPAPR